ncbi:MAG: hypothetical protein JSR37_06760 [Verrucomicrobia bacterium]|nr:hypothetical protein [Verrucomicrobiota bacterium]MBS0636778.1 hypothetical protein [Verrucomicrobiota bacterium]
MTFEIGRMGVASCPQETFAQFNKKIDSEWSETLGRYVETIPEAKLAEASRYACTMPYVMRALESLAYNHPEFKNVRKLFELALLEGQFPQAERASLRHIYTSGNAPEHMLSLANRL